MLSLVYAFFPWLGAGILSDWNFGGATWWVAWLGCAVLCAPIVYWYQKKDSTCPSCNKAWVAHSTGTETISRHQIFKRETETNNGVSRKVNVPYDVRVYWDFQACESCDHTWKIKRESQTKA